MKSRPRLGFALAALAALFIYLYWPEGPVEDATPAPGDCVQFELWSNGFHTDLVTPASLLPPDHPIRRLYPDAQSFMIGWGDEKFYLSDGKDILAGIDALIPPSATTIHVVAGDQDVRDYFIPKIRARVAVNHAAAARLAAFIANDLPLGADSKPIVIHPGKLALRSAFLRARSPFHLFRVCNHWMAEAMRAAGLNLNARTAWLSDPLVKAAARQGGECPLPKT